VDDPRERAGIAEAGPVVGGDRAAGGILDDEPDGKGLEGLAEQRQIFSVRAGHRGLHGGHGVTPATTSAAPHPNRPVMYASVRSSSGLVKIFPVGPTSIRRPGSPAAPTVKKAVVSLTRAACCMLWVTMTIV
jgi:hypothetical protein